jgi:hypothetical protein
MPLVTRAERQAENFSLGKKIVFFIVLYTAATTCFIIFA